MTIRLAPALAMFGLLSALFGAVMGLTPIHRGGVSCGSALRPDTGAAETQDFTNAIQADAFGVGESDVSAVTHACSAAVSDRKPIALGVLIPGTVLLLLGVGIAAREHWTAQEATAAEQAQSATAEPEAVRTE